MNLTVPTIHLNGTSATDLTNGWEDAYAALSTAYDALKRTAPNGRDFYVQDRSNPLVTSMAEGLAIHRATEEHVSRLQRIDDIRKELEFLCEAVNDQVNGTFLNKE